MIWGIACDLDACLAYMGYSISAQAMHLLQHIQCGAKIVLPTFCTKVIAVICKCCLQCAFCTWPAANGTQTALGESALTSGEAQCQTIISLLLHVSVNLSWKKHVGILDALQMRVNSLHTQYASHA